MKKDESSIKNKVGKYYDLYGWKKEDDTYIDSVLFEDLRPVSENYRHNCHLRLKNYLPEEGKYLLDIASGPITYPEYLEYSEHYCYHLCADISVEALREARKKLGGKGLCVQCDIVNLPFMEGSVDSFISLHTIYHVPAEEQLNAVFELHRVLKSDSCGLIVYTWAHFSLLMNLTMPFVLIIKGFNRLKRIAKLNLSGSPDLYFKAFSYKWFLENVFSQLNVELLIWRSVSVRFLKYYIHERFFGEKILSAIFSLENKFPNFFGRYGYYPLFIIKKNNKN